MLSQQNLCYALFLLRGSTLLNTGKDVLVLGKHVKERWYKYPSIMRLRAWFERKAGDPRFVSERSIETYTESVRGLIHDMGFKDPEIFIEKYKDGRDLTALLGDWIDHLRTVRKNAPTTQIRKYHNVKKWLQVNDIDIDWKKIQLPTSRTVVRDKAPTRAELRKILMYSPPWLNAAIMVLATSGLRSGALTQLRLRNLDISTHPDVGVIEVPPEANKAKVGYYTFITPEAKEALRIHHEHRRELGETMTPDSPLIKSPRVQGQPSYKSLMVSYARVLDNAGLDARGLNIERVGSRSGGNPRVLHLHTLRKWFRTQLEGVMTSSYIERLMGHTSTAYLDSSYFRPPEEDMIAAYRRAIPNLTILEDVQSEEFQRKQLIRQAALLLPEEKLRRLQELLAREKNIDVAVEEFRKLREQPEKNGTYNVVNSESEMLRKLQEGWELVRELNGNKFLLKKIS
jgi:integrase